MDFLDPNKKRAHGIRLMVGYILIGLIVATVSLILLFQSYGYDLDRKTGTIIQNGLVFVSAHPESAQIFVNGQDKGNTDARLAIPAGQYTFELKRDGYRSWKRTFALDGGQVERLTYPMLFPDKLNPKDVQLYGSVPSFATVSLDRHWILVQQPQNFGSFDVFDANQDDPNPSVLTLPDGLLAKTNGAQSLSLVEWSTDNRHLLIRHDFAEGFEFIVVDREDPASSINVNKQLNLTPAKVVLHDKKYDQLYVYDDKTLALQTADLKSKQVQPYLSDVLAFKSYGSDTMLYVARTSTSNKAELKLMDGGTNYTLRNIAQDTVYALDIARYSNNWFIVAAAKSESTVTIYKNPQDILKNKSQSLLTPTSFLRLEGSQFASFSANTQFIAIQSGSKFAVYDAEKDRRYYFTLPFTLSPGGQQARWMDSGRLVVVQDNKTVVFDYDGINQQTLSATNPGFEPIFDRDYIALYTIAPSVTVPGRAALTRTSLKVNP